MKYNIIGPALIAIGIILMFIGVQIGLSGVRENIDSLTEIASINHERIVKLELEIFN